MTLPTTQMPDPDLLACLHRVETFLRNHNTPAADWISALISRHTDDPAAFWQQLNSTRFWGGAGSIANAALADNPGISDLEWKMQVRAFREDLIAIAGHIEVHGQMHPDIQSWLLAFHNWNNAGQ